MITLRSSPFARARRASACLLGLLSLLSEVRAAGETYALKPVNAVTQDFSWTRIENLAEHTLNCLAVAADGSLWLGAGSEVVRYDGVPRETVGSEQGLGQGRVIDLLVTRNNRLYVFQRDQISVLVDGRCQTIYQGRVNFEVMEIASESADGTVWAAGSEGLFQINDDRVLLHRSDHHLATVFEDHAGNLWTAVLNDGRTYRIKRKGDLIAPTSEWELLLDTKARRTSRYGFVQALDGVIWRFSTDPDDPARAYDPAKGGWRSVDFRPFGSSNQVQGHYRTRDGVVWAVSDGVLHGLVDGEWTIHRPLASRHGPMRADLAQAPNGDLWLLDYNVSLYRIDYAGRHWQAFDGLLYQGTDADGGRWFLTRAGEVVWQPAAAGQPARRFDGRDGVIATPVNLLMRRDGAVWAIGADQGAAAVAWFDGRGRWQSRRFPELGESFQEDAMLELPDGDLLLSLARLEHWIWSERGALVRIDPRGEVRTESVRPASFIPPRVVGLELDAAGTIWINEGYTIYKWDGGDRRPEAVFTRPDYWIDDFCLGVSGELWLANWGSGIIRQRPARAPEFFGEREGLASRFVTQLLFEPRDGALLALTSEGLERFDGDRWHGVGGAVNLVNNRDASFLHVEPSGALWIAQGTRPWLTRGFAASVSLDPAGERFRSVVFRPETDPPDTFIEVLHQPDDRDQGLSVNWWGVDPWSDTPVNGLRYSYRLDDRSWSEFSAERKHSFHQLNDGPHVLEVRARDQAFNIDPTPVRLEFAIPPPFWRQPWFVASGGATVATILLLVAVILRQRWRHLIEYDEQRISFFTNISHELRTPLALIMAPLEKAVRKTRDDRQVEDLQLALRSARRLNQLVDQLLDFRKIESGAMEVSRVDGDLVQHLHEIVGSFQSLAESKGQQLEFYSRCVDCRAAYDPDKVQKVVANLVVNALKYTPRGGRIRVSFDRSQRVSAGAPATTWAVLAIEDNGRGIPRSRQAHIFKPFYRGDSKAAQEATGTGLGLSLSSQLVRLMGGELTVVSPVYHDDEERPGSRFTLRLPLVDAAPAEAPVEAVPALENSVGEDDSAAAGERALRVLLIDDNEDLRMFIGRELAQRYLVTLAEDGEDGLAKARAEVPDLVIADVMMPRLNGMEFCRALKSDPATSHIPVIMLTARSSSEFEQLGLESGAEEYLTKPISLPKLELRIANLLETRARLQERLRAQVLAEPPVPERNDPEAVFLRRVIDVIETHLADGTCGVDELAMALAMSRSSFYRKLKAVAGEAPNDFIRRYRLQRAAQLLEQTTLSVTDVMLEVGYAELGHFGKLFRSFHGHSPSEHRSRAKREAERI